MALAAIDRGTNRSATAPSRNDTARVTGDNSDATPASGNDNASTTVSGPKPVNGRSTGSVSINTGDNSLSGKESGVSSQFGKYTLSLTGQSTNSDGNISSSGRVTIVAANGDQVTGNFTLSGPANAALTAVVTIDGGTERFANATGTLTVICTPSGSPSQEGLVLVIKHDCTTEGAIRLAERGVGVDGHHPVIVASASVDLRPKKPPPAPRHPGQPDARVFTGAM